MGETEDKLREIGETFSEGYPSDVQHRVEENEEEGVSELYMEFAPTHQFMFTRDAVYMGTGSGGRNRVVDRYNVEEINFMPPPMQKVKVRLRLDED
jgi:hypothetical protein